MTRRALIRIDRYTRGAILLHWAIAALVLVNLTIGLLHESLLRGVAGAMPLHLSIGIAVLALSLARIGWRLAYRPPPPPIALSALERRAAAATHIGFYALLLILPLTGWMLVSGKPTSKPFGWFGLFDVPPLPVTRAVSGVAHQAHGVLGYAMAALVLLHVAAALRHHFVLRDGVLARMIPVLLPRG
ncbi:cytochrome b [Sphingomonas sp. MMS24-J45]|uniref:cytochrome b n=1 Tax=Sphingomonas sp. MMS24-J45 TaxID=3238806 RepID=UPI003850A706